MIGRITCLCEENTFFYPIRLRKKKEAVAFNVFCEKCNRTLAIIIKGKETVVTEADIPELFFKMDIKTKDKYGIFFYSKVGEYYVKEKFKG